MGMHILKHFINVAAQRGMPIKMLQRAIDDYDFKFDSDSDETRQSIKRSPNWPPARPSKRISSFGCHSDVNPANERM